MTIKHKISLNPSVNWDKIIESQQELLALKVKEINELKKEIVNLKTNKSVD